MSNFQRVIQQSLKVFERGTIFSGCDTSWPHLLYISTSGWVLCTPNAGWNSNFQHFCAKKLKNCKKKSSKIGVKFSKKLFFWVFPTKKEPRICNINQRLTICQQMLQTWCSNLFLFLQRCVKTWCIYSLFFVLQFGRFKLARGACKIGRYLTTCTSLKTNGIREWILTNNGFICHQFIQYFTLY